MVVEGYGPGHMEKMGLSGRRPAQLRPGLIYVSETAYGHVGPWALRKGWENIVQAVTGVLIDHGSEDSPPVAPVELISDVPTGYLGALGIETDRVAFDSSKAERFASGGAAPSMPLSRWYFQVLGVEMIQG